MYCPNCGAALPEGAEVCLSCGKMVNRRRVVVDDGFAIAIKVFLILGCIAGAAALFPLAWCIPMTVKGFRALNNGQPLSLGYKICTLIFVSRVAGILLLCTDRDLV